MKNLILVILSVISAVTCSEFIVLNTPKSIEFKGSSQLPSELLSDVLLASLGYSVHSGPWDGLYVNDPFNTADLVVSVVVEGAEKLDFDSASKSYDLSSDEVNFEDDFLYKVNEHSHRAIDVNLIDKVHEDVVVDAAFGPLPKSTLEGGKYLKLSNKYDEEFLNQIAYLESLSKLFTEEKEKIPTALNVRVSMKMLPSGHKDDDPKLVDEVIAEAKKLLIESIKKLSTTISTAYKGNALVSVVSVAEHHHSRSKRQAVDPPKNGTDPYNLAALTSKDYPVFFNIILWFSIIMIFALIAISLALSNVEDKDSIIYRMTGARGKKDN